MHLKAKEVRVLGTIDCQAREVESEENVKCLFWSSRSRRVPHGTERVWLATGDAEFFFSLSLLSLRYHLRCDMPADSDVVLLGCSVHGMTLDQPLEACKLCVYHFLA